MNNKENKIMMFIACFTGVCIVINFILIGAFFYVLKAI